VKIVISGGGTGGHIYPALTIANYIKELEPEAEITFVGTRLGLEKDIVHRYGYPLEFITVAGFERHLGLGTLKSAMKLLVGLQDAARLLDKLKPDLVIGTGGYVCGPILFRAARKGLPTCIQEQNAMPGVTNKILARFVQKIFLGYAEGAKYFQGKAQKIYTGNPVRKEVLQADRNEGLAKFALDPEKKTILAFGGSRGARSINKAMALVEQKLAGRQDVQILHATGALDYQQHVKQLGEQVIQADNIKVVPYIHEMPLALAAADIAVSRAGAIGLAELMVKGIPSILIPYPYATANHQEFNARALEAAGAAAVIVDKALNGEVLFNKINTMLESADNLSKMHQAAMAASKPQAAENIAKEALSLVRKN